MKFPRQRAAGWGDKEKGTKIAETETERKLEAVGEEARGRAETLRRSHCVLVPSGR